MKSKKLFINVLACLVSFVTVLGINFFLTPYISENIGTDAYGFVSLANNFVNYASIITLALNSMASRFISVAIFKKDEEEANKYFTSVLIANMVMILILLVPSILCVVYLDKLIVIPNNLVFSVKILFMLIFINFYLGLINSTYSVSTYAADRMELYTIRNMETSIIKIVLMLMFFYLFDANIIVVGIATVLSTLYLLFWNIKYKKKLLPFLTLKKRYFELKKIVEILMAGIWNTITKIGQVLSDGLDLLVTNIFINPIAMGQLSIAKTISSSVSLLTLSLVNIFQPNVTKMYANNDEKIVDEIKFSMKIVSYFSNVLLVGVMCFGYQFYKLWLPNENASLLANLTIITLFGNVIGTSINALFSVFTITNKLKTNSLVTLFLGFFNILLVFVLLKFNLVDEPIYVVASVSIITGIIKNLTFIPMYTAKCLNVKLTSFYPPIFRSMLSSLIMAVIFGIVSNLFVINTWIKLILVAIICGVLGFIISFILTFSKGEIKKCMDLFKAKVLKYKEA